ncbi:hypothetical protein [Hydrogenimonas sp. SS33]|uniref:hypothetical protein n=1 Tax=Hydrogenimonas leucolamina TaxID=2954236 RepID=UPI00336BD55B
MQITVKKMKEEPEVVLVDLPAREALALLERVSRENWYLQTGEKATGKVTKDRLTTRKLKEDVSDTRLSRFD